MTILTTKQAAKIAGVNEDTICKWCEALKVYSQKVGKSWAIDENSLRHYVENVRPQTKKRKPRGQQFSIGASVRQDQIEENQRKMAQLEEDVQSGKIKPLRIPSGIKSLRELNHGTNSQ